MSTPESRPSHSPLEIAEFAHSVGWRIATARSAERLEEVFDPLITTLVNPEELNLDNPLISRWARTFRDPEFMIGIARETAVHVGTTLLLHADYDESLASPPGCVVPLKAFMAGLRRGGMGNNTSKALVGRTIAYEAESRFLYSSSYPAFDNPLGLLEIGKQLEVFDWRERIFLWQAQNIHRRRHAIDGQSVRKLLKHMNERPTPGDTRRYPAST